MFSFSRIVVVVVGFAASLPATLRAQSNYATPYTFSTIAGGAGLSGNADGPVASARFNAPYGVLVDSSGNIFVGDSGNHAIRKISGGGVMTYAGVAAPTAFGSTDGIGSAARFRSPRSLAIDAAGTLYVADTGNNAVRKITPGALVSTVGPAFYSAPGGIAVDSAGNVYVADTSNHAVRKIDLGGTVTVFAGSVGTGGFADGPGASARFLFPQGLSIDRAGNLYLCEFTNCTIRKITPAGVVSTIAGSANQIGSTDATGTAARFNRPFGTAVDGAGNVFVADSYNNLIRKITPVGVVTTIGGLVNSPGSTNGAGSVARFDSPVSISVDGAGNLYIAETNNHTIRLGTPPSGEKLPGINVPLLVPAGATAVEARELAEQPGYGVVVALSASYAVRPSGGGAQALVAPNYTNPQPYNLSYVVRLLANGQPDPAFTSAPGGDGTVNAVTVQADGKILVGGTFASFNTVFFKNLARLQADGKADSTFLIGSGPDAQVNALALQSDGKILVGGLFQNFQGQPRPYLLRLNSTGSVDTAFSPAVNGAVNTIAVQADGNILIGGNFTSAGGAARARLARLLASGSNDSTFDPGAGANDEVVSLLVQGNGAIVASGDFTTFAGQSRGRLARVLSSGALDSTFSAANAANGTVLCLGLQADGKILLGGAFTTVNGVARVRLARLSSDGALDPTFDPATGFNKDVRAMLVRSDGTAFLAGLFDQYQGASVNEIVAVSGNVVTTVFLQAPLALAVGAGGTARFVAEAAGPGLTYQWQNEGVAISGATSSALTLSNVSAGSAGRYTLVVTSATGATLSGDATLTILGAASTSQIINLSVLTSIDAPGGEFTLGFVIGGAGTSGVKPLLVRAAGPQLAQFAVGSPLADPKLQFFSGTTLVGENDNWNGSAALSGLMSQVGAFPYTTPTSKDAAFAPANLTAVSNSVVVASANGGIGPVLAEVYDATPAGSLATATPRLINVSVLKNIPAGALLTAGFVITGSVSKTVLVRAIGPTLAGFGVGGTMADPQLKLFSGATQIATNDNWGGSAVVKAAINAVGAFALDPGTKDAALLIALPPGSYTAQASSTDNASGAALVEVYEVP